MFALALHGGAGANRQLNYDSVRKHMRSVLEKARGELAAGASALDVAVSAVVEMESSGLYVAGLGASPNNAGEYELDACVMDGPTRRAGAVASVRNVVNPVSLARMVMERTPHVMLCGAGAERFGRSHGAVFVEEPDMRFTRAGAGESNFSPANGTVGCVVRDNTGGLASATSTAGVFNKTPGRVGDSPLIGCGGWADSYVAVSCTGQGEIFIRTAAAAQLAFRVRAGADVGAAASGVMADVQSLNGEGGLIAIDRDGNIAMPYHAEGMKRAWMTSDGELGVAVFEQ